MRCAKCGGENPEEAAYCALCGAAMGVPPTAAPAPRLWRVVRLIGGGLLMLLGGLVLVGEAVAAVTGLTSTTEDLWMLFSLAVVSGLAIVRRLSSLSSAWRRLLAVQAAALALLGLFWAAWVFLADPLHVRTPTWYELARSKQTAWVVIDLGRYFMRERERGATDPAARLEAQMRGRSLPQIVDEDPAEARRILAEFLGPEKAERFLRDAGYMGGGWWRFGKADLTYALVCWALAGLSAFVAIKAHPVGEC